MAEVLVNETYLTDIADAIREKNGTTDTYKPREMAAAISSITTGSGDSGESSSGEMNHAIINGYTIQNGSNLSFDWDLSAYIPNNTTPFYCVICLIAQGDSSTGMEQSTDPDKAGIAYYFYYDGSTFTQLGASLATSLNMVQNSAGSIKTMKISESGVLSFFPWESNKQALPNMRAPSADPNNIIIFY